MSSSITAAVASRAGRLLTSRRRLVRRGVAVLTGAMILGAAAWWSLGGSRGGDQAETRGARPAPEVAIVPRATPPAGQAETVRIDEERQRAIGLRTARVVLGVSFDVLTAPGLVAPNETQYAYITPRASRGRPLGHGPRRARTSRPATCWRRSTARRSARPGSSSTPGSRRSRSRGPRRTGRRRSIATPSISSSGSRKGRRPSRSMTAFADRPVGENRERLMTAYAQYRLAVATMERNRELFAQKLITPKQFEQGQRRLRGGPGHLPEPDGPDGLRGPAGEHPGPAGPEAGRDGGAGDPGTAADPRRQARRHRARGRARQGRRRQAGRDAPRAGPVGAAPLAEKPETILPPEKPRSNRRRRSRSGPCLATEPKPDDAPVSTYSIWAPFDGTILDREMIVPGRRRRHDPPDLHHWPTSRPSGSRRASTRATSACSPAAGAQTIRFRSPAYPGRVFEGEVIYTGDLVEEKSRTVKLLARREQPRPAAQAGHVRRGRGLQPAGPATASCSRPRRSLTQGSRTFVYVRRRARAVRPPRGRGRARRGDERRRS